MGNPWMSKRGLSGVLAVVAAAVLVSLGVVPAGAVQSAAEKPSPNSSRSAAGARVDAVQATLDRIADDPISLRAFFVGLPKGADLHQHLSGTVYAESMLRWAAADGDCLTPPTMTVTAPPCTTDQIPAASALTNTTLQSQVISAWSMRLFIPSLTESGHDHFFNSFGRFGGALDGPGRVAAGLAEVLDQAARDHVVRIETKSTPSSPSSAAMVSALTAQAPGASADVARFPEAMAALRAGGFDTVVAQSLQQAEEVVSNARRILQCDTANANPGCEVSLGFVGQTNRNSTNDKVFASLATSFGVAAAQGSRWVAVDLVSPEDGLYSLGNYSLQMQMLKYLSSLYPQVAIDVHAGELIPGLVPPADLTSHISQAVLVAGSDRIGHGVDIRGETNAKALLRTMRDRGVTVEIALTSNEQILGINAQTSQFRVYRDAGVPVVLATDDAGVERTDLSEQYQKAHDWFDLSYQDLKQLSYQGITASFVSPAERASLKSRLDAAFGAFERTWGRASH